MSGKLARHFKSTLFTALIHTTAPFANKLLIISIELERTAQCSGVSLFYIAILKIFINYFVIDIQFIFFRTSFTYVMSTVPDSLFSTFVESKAVIYCNNPNSHAQWRRSLGFCILKNSKNVAFAVLRVKPMRFNYENNSP